MDKEPLNIVFVGHVDHGKSTLIGRLLYDTDNFTKEQYEKIKRLCEREGKDFEYAFFLDAFEEERSQGVTIDTTEIYFKSNSRSFRIIDAPGHKEFLKNMISGSSKADAAFLLIDAFEGIRNESKRHCYLLHLLGIKEIVVLINKMDLVDYSEEKYNNIVVEYKNYLSKLGISVQTFVPMSAKLGENVIKRSKKMPWHLGGSILEVLNSLKEPSSQIQAQLRFPIQDVYKFDERRILAGKIESGKITTGDEILFLPANKKAVVKEILKWNVPGSIYSAHGGESIGITLEDQIYVERGDIISHTTNPPLVSPIFDASLFWMGAQPLEVGKNYILKAHTSSVEAQIISIKKIIDSSTLETQNNTAQITRDNVAEVTIRTKQSLAFDNFSDLAHTGRFVLVDNHVVSGGGIIDFSQYPNRAFFDSGTQKSSNIKWHDNKITLPQRETLNKHKGVIIWLTGLSGSGKSTIATQLEKELFDRNCRSYILDGDNVRHGLNNDLAFSPEERAENIRRVGEVAKLFCDAGLIVITAFISPYQQDRDRVKSIVEAGQMIEVYVKCSVEECIKRDPKNLYKKAQTGEIKNFTGISAPYIEPQNPQVILDTKEIDIQECVSQILNYLNKNSYLN